MMTSIPDIAFKIEGDLITLEQSTGCGEAAMVELHRLHVAHLAAQIGLCADQRLQRALLRLWAKIYLLTADCYLDEIVERCLGGLTYQAYAFDARNMLADILEDLGIEAPTYEHEASAPVRNEKSGAGISVTQDAGISVTPQRGRPATGEAMTNAERQARYRAKQADLLPEGVA